MKIKGPRYRGSFFRTMPEMLPAPHHLSIQPIVSQHEKYLIGKRFDSGLLNSVMNKSNLPVFATLMVMLVTLSSCDVVEGIFKAGFWSAIIVIVLIVAVVMWLIGKTRRRR